MIDLEVKHKERKIKIIENCYNMQNDDFQQNIHCDRCIFISKNVLDKFVNDSTINFRLIIKRKDLLEAENLIKEHYFKEHILSCRQSTNKNEMESQLVQKQQNNKINNFFPKPAPRTRIHNKSLLPGNNNAAR